MTEFLREPDLFPARIAGETWGTDRCDLELAGEIFRIEGLSASQLESLTDRYGPRLQAPSDTNVAATLQMFRAPASDFLEIDTRGWEYWVDLQWSDNGFALSGMRVMARVDAERAGIWTCVDDPAELSGVVENVLRPLLAARLLANGGLLVHSAAVDGYLFAGKSGAGKSTIARLGLDAGLPVLSDDLNALVPLEQRALGPSFAIAPLPFTGDLEERDVSNTRTPLRAILGLEHAEHESLQPMTIAETVSLLVRCAPYVNQDPRRMPLLLDRASAIAVSTARGVVAFRRDGHVWPILDVATRVN